MENANHNCKEISEKRDKLRQELSKSLIIGMDGINSDDKVLQPITDL